MYAVFAAAGFICAAAVYILLLKARASSLRLPLFAAACSCVGLFCGARLFGYAASHIYYLDTGKVIPPGFVFYGGLFGFLAVFALMQKSIFGKTSPLLCDLAAVFIPLFHSVGRVGCFFAPCCGGSFFGLPVQLVESGFNLVLFLVLILLFFKRKPRGGLLCLYLMNYGIFRFFIEFYRTDAERGIIGSLSFSQWISIAVVTVCLIIRCKNTLEFCRKKS